MLKITNTLTGNKEVFKSLEPNKVKLYVCGITPYDDAHVGHGRCYVTFDLLVRVLRFLNFEVTYCRNITDIDDKILKKAKDQYGSTQFYNKITDQYIKRFHDEMNSLNCLAPTIEPRVTENIDTIISFISKLLDAGKAYVANGDVYYHIKKFSGYGKLSKHKLEDLYAGVRIDVNEKKHDPLDFALWKHEPEGQFWKSPWGHGRPGWHIECSALAEKYLGKQIDIHGGGMDLIFPHHENEIAQSEGLFQVPFARYWMHNGLVRIDHEKMSKSLGNFFTLRDIFAHHDPMVLRFDFINHYYRAPLDFSLSALSSIKKSYQRLCRFFEACDDEDRILTEGNVQSDVVKKMLTYLLDDFNTPGMLGVLFESLDSLKEDEEALCEVKLFVQQVLGLTLQQLPDKEVTLTPEIKKLLCEREKARAHKDWVRADEIRDQLLLMGVQVHDKKIGNK